jgi:hypothetical protein
MNKRAKQIVRILQKSFKNEEAVFADTKELLENQRPRGVRTGSREHANFLFYLISQDHGTKSAKLYERAKSLYQEHPDLFDPVSVAKTYRSESDMELATLLKMLGVRYPNNATKFWYHNSTRLTSEFGGDSRNIFRALGSDVVKTIRSFQGFGPKIGGLLLRVFVGTGMANIDEIGEVDFPTDIHDTRIAALTRIADIPTDITELNYSPYVRTAQNVWRSACREAGADWLEVDRALWILGSKGCVSGRHHDCPLRAYCIKGDLLL